MKKIVIEKLAVHNDSKGMTHCWAPIVNGRVAQHVNPDTGKGEPCRSVRGAKSAAARVLNVDVDSLEFDVRR
jgi:hypothetical protein